MHKSRRDSCITSHLASQLHSLRPCSTELRRTSHQCCGDGHTRTFIHDVTCRRSTREVATPVMCVCLCSVHMVHFRLQMAPQVMPASSLTHGQEATMSTLVCTHVNGESAQRFESSCDPRRWSRSVLSQSTGCTAGLGRTRQQFHQLFNTCHKSVGRLTTRQCGRVVRAAMIVSRAGGNQLARTLTPSSQQAAARRAQSRNIIWKSLRRDTPACNASLFVSAPRSRA